MGSIELIAPELINTEVGNILWKGHMFGGLDIELAVETLVDFAEMRLKLVPTTELLYDAFSLAITHKRTVYDSMYLALAEREHCPFVTADKKLYNAVSGAMPHVILPANWR